MDKSSRIDSVAVMDKSSRIDSVYNLIFPYIPQEFCSTVQVKIQVI